MIASGNCGLGALTYPFVPLSDGAGEVVELVPAVSTRQVGDRVMGAFFQKWIEGPFDANKAASALGGAIDGVLSEYVVLEEGGAATLQSLLRAVRDGGHLVLVGLLSGAPAERDVAQRNDRAIRIDSVYVGSARQLQRMNAAIDDAELHPIIDRVFPLEATKQAYRYLESGAHLGKIVIRI